MYMIKSPVHISVTCGHGRANFHSQNTCKLSGSTQGHSVNSGDIQSIPQASLVFSTEFSTTNHIVENAICNYSTERLGLLRARHPLKIKPPHFSSRVYTPDCSVLKNECQCTTHCISVWMLCTPWFHSKYHISLIFSRP